jgi:hypothetical protein
MAKVRVGNGVTRNLGDYNSLRLDVEVELDFDQDKRDVNDVLTEAWKTAEDNLQAKIEEYEA